MGFLRETLRELNETGFKISNLEALSKLYNRNSSPCFSKAEEDIKDKTCAKVVLN